MDSKKTFIMLKPDALKRGLTYEIMEYFFKNNFKVEAMNIVLATEEKAKVHYEEVIENLGVDFEAKLLKYICGNFVVPIVLSHESCDAVAKVREILGATNPVTAAKGTIRGDLGIDSYEKCNAENRSCENLVHASDSIENVIREISIWLPSYNLIEN